jgi:hypothetical protein
VAALAQEIRRQEDVVRDRAAQGGSNALHKVFL